MRKFRNIPALVTLLAGFVSSVVMIIQKYSLVHLETEEEKPSEDEGTAGEGEGTPEQTEEEQQEEK